MNHLGEILKFQGIPIIENPYLPEFSPILKLKDDVPCTDTFRNEFNAWLENLFGRNRNFYVFNGNITTHPNNKRFLQLQIGNLI